MPRYDALRYDPPAPVAEAALRAGGATVPGVFLLIDTGADATLLPREAIRRLGVTPDPALTYELVGFDGSRTATQAVDLDLLVPNRLVRGRYLRTDDAHGILGRDVRSGLGLLLDGPGQVWSQHARSP